mgnify:FL=1
MGILSLIYWLFFDIGSTLVEEKQALDDFVNRCVEKLVQVGIKVSYADYHDQLLRIAVQGGDPIHEAWNCFAPNHLERPRWSHEKERLYPQVRSALKALRTRYHLGIIANQGNDLSSRLERFGILDDFEIIISSTDIGLSKPDIRIFQLAVEQANIEPSQAIYVGDRVDNDIIPAKKLGMRTIRMRQGLGQYGSEDPVFQSDWQVSNVQELLQIL